MISNTGDWKEVKKPVTRRYSLTVAFRKYNGLQEINASQPKALLLSSQKKKKDLSMPRRMTTILYYISEMTNCQFYLTFSTIKSL